ncbi:MAG: YcfL family protein [Moraxellaceae bacterium]|nr:YcfL family protein [Moraxellaceae bacterium]
MKKIAMAAFLGSSLLLAACASSPSSKIVNYRGGELAGVIEVQKSAVVATEGGLPQVRAILFNKSGVAQKFEYKIVWLDEHEMPVDEENRPWKSGFLNSKDQLSVNSTGPHDKAKRFQIQIRNPQGVTK